MCVRSNLAETARFLTIMITVKDAIPTRAIILFIGIGAIDLVTTAVLHAQGHIVELNPLMRLFIDQSEWLFAFVKGLTLVGGWFVLAWYARFNLAFVRKAALWGSVAYMAVWLSWFVGAMAMPASTTSSPPSAAADPEVVRSPAPSWQTSLEGKTLCRSFESSGLRSSM